MKLKTLAAVAAMLITIRASWAGGGAAPFDEAPLIQAGYSYDAPSKQWVDAQGRAIQPRAIIDLFSDAVISQVSEGAGTNDDVSRNRQARLDAVKAKVDAGRYSVALMRVSEGKVAVSVADDQSGAARTAGTGPAVRVGDYAVQTWDGAGHGLVGPAAENPNIIKVKGGGSSGGSRGGSYGGSRGGSYGGSRGGSFGGSSGGSRGGSFGGSSGGSRGGSFGGGRGESPKAPRPESGRASSGNRSSGQGSSPAPRPSQNPVISNKVETKNGRTTQTQKFSDGSERRTVTTKDGKEVSTHNRPGGGSTTRTKMPDGTTVRETKRVDPKTGKASITKVVTDKNGKQTTFHANGAKTERVTSGNTTTVTRTSPGGRSVQTRTSTSGDTRTVTKVTTVNGRSVTVVNNYHSYGYGGYYYYGYHPMFWWNPFMPWGWFFAPYPSPFYYPWGVYGYVGYWGGYYAPYPSYTYPYWWVTDWILIDYLAQQRADAIAQKQQQQTAQQAAIDKQIKDQVAAQVKDAMAAYQQKDEKKLTDLGQAMNKKHIFIVNDSVSVTAIPSEEECELNQGDLFRLEKTPDEIADGDGSYAQIKVLTAQKDSCKAGTQASISLSDLQEMLNAFAQRVEKGSQQMDKEKKAGCFDSNSGAKSPACGGGH